MSGRKAAGGPGDGCLCLLPRGSLFLFRSGRVSAPRPAWESARPALWLSCPRCGRGRPHSCWGPCCSAASPSPPPAVPRCGVTAGLVVLRQARLHTVLSTRELTHVTASQVCARSMPVLTLTRTRSHTHSHADGSHVRICSPSDMCPHHVLVHTQAPVHTCGHWTHASILPHTRITCLSADVRVRGSRPQQGLHARCTRTVRSHWRPRRTAHTPSMCPSPVRLCHPARGPGPGVTASLQYGSGTRGGGAWGPGLQLPAGIGLKASRPPAGWRDQAGGTQGLSCPLGSQGRGLHPVPAP